MLPDLSVVVMAYNEDSNLEVTVTEIDEVLKELGRSYEVIIINDGSSDRTGEIANRLGQQMERAKVVHHETNQGLGGVYRTGFVHAQGEFVTFFPADGQFPATIIKQFVSSMSKVDMTLGYLPNRDSSLLAKFLSKGERVLYSLLFGSMPEFQGILMFKRALLTELELKSTGRGWAVLMELIIRTYKGGYRVTSIPTEMRPRISGRSKVNNARTIWANIKQVVALRFYL